MFLSTPEPVLIPLDPPPTLAPNRRTTGSLLEEEGLKGSETEQEVEFKRENKNLIFYIVLFLSILFLPENTNAGVPKQ